MLFWPILGIFWCSVVTSVTFSNNLNIYKKNIKKKIKKKTQKNYKKSQKI